MKTRLLKPLILLIWFTSAGTLLFGQETTDNATYYYNNFETSTAGNTISLGATTKGNAYRGFSSTTADASTTSPLNGSVSLTSIKPTFNAIGYIRWNFVGNGVTATDLTQNDWEWDFIYKNNSTLNPDDPDQMAVGNNSWRYWLIANGYNTNNTQGFYISHIGTNLVLRYRYDNFTGAGRYNTILTCPISNNVTYIIKVQRLKGGSWAIYMDPFVAGMTTAQTLATSSTGTTGSGYSSYYYSYIDNTCTTSARFQWDDLNMYTRILQFTAVGANSVSVNNITPSPLYPNQANVIMYGLKVVSRGNFNINQLVFPTTGAGFDGYFNGTGTLYKTTNPFYTIASATSVASLTLTGNSASNYSLNDYIASSGNTDGTLSVPEYYFLVGTVKSTLNYGSAPTGTIAFNGVSTVNGNGNSTAITYSVTGSSTGNTMSFLNTVAAPTASGVANCGAGTVTLTASGGLPSGGTYNWYSVASGGTALQSSTSATYSPYLVATTTYYVSYTVGGSTSSRTAVTATINPVVSSPYAGAYFSYPFSGNMNDVSGNGNNGVPTGAPSFTADRYGAATSAYTFNGSSQYISTSTAATSPTTFTISLWFNTTVAGGKLIGYGNLQTGASATYDRHLYMTSTGQLSFGLYDSGFDYITTTNTYNDGNWHHVIVTVAADGTNLYVDGSLQVSKSSMIPSVNYSGYWRIGYDNISTSFYPNATSNAYFNGKLDDIAVYNTELTSAQIASSNNLNQIGNYSAVCAGSPITFYAPTITGATYTWSDSGGTMVTGQNPTFTTAKTGNYTLTVTGGPGGCSSTATVIPNILAAPVSTFTATSPVNVGSNSTITYTGTYVATSTYTWNFNGGTIISGSGVGPYSVQWATAGTKTVSLTVTNSAGCPSSSTQNVTVLAPPSVTNVSNCGAGSVTITASGGAPAGGTYNWYASNTSTPALQSTTSATFSPYVVATRTYYVSYTSGGFETNRTPVTVTINPVVSSPYAGAAFSYPFSGNTNDVSGNGNNGIATGGPTLTADRFGAANSAYSFNGSSQYMSATALVNNPNVYTISLWFNTTTAGGKLFGFGSSQTGASGADDRHIYMSASGQLYYGIYQSGSVYTINTSASYNDGNWHHIVVTMGSDGSTLYVDGTVQASNATMTNGQNYSGYWRIGYDNENGWPNTTANSYFTGALDDIAVYNRELSSSEIASSDNLNQIGNYSSVCPGNPISFYAPTITGATYTWRDSGGTTVTGQNPTFASAVTGNYTLTVTGGPGGCSSTATIVPAINAPSATFTATSTVLVGNNATVTYTGTDPATSTYTWNFNGGTVLSGTGQGPYQVQWASTGTKTITLSVTNAAGCTASSSQTVTVSAASGWYSNYVYREKITINKTLVPGNADLSNFPLLIKVVDPNLIYTTGICTNKVQSATLADLAFTDGTSGQTAELPYQIDTYDNTTGTLYVWVKVPIMAASGSTTPATSINMYYGSSNPPVVHNTAFQQTTWNGATSSNVNYNSVWHFNEAVSTTTYSVLDGTSSGVNLIAYNNLVSNITSSQIGNGIKFSSTVGVGGNLSSNLTVGSYPVNGQPMTMSFWCYYPNTPGTGGTNATQNGMVLTNPGAALIQLGFTNNVVELWPSGGRGTPYANSSSFPSNGAWHYYSYSWNGTSNALYIDGVAQTASATYNPTGQSALAYNRIMFGDYPNDVYSEEFDGSIDEAHLIPTALTPAWVQTEYNNQLNPTNLGTAPFIANIANIEYNITNYNNGYSPGSLVYTWTGTSGTGVATAANWNITSITPNVSGVAPSGVYSSISIPGGASSYPQLSAAFPIYSLTVASGAQLNLNGYSMSVGCHIYNSSGGQILYGGNAASGITWNGSLPNQYYYGSATLGTGQAGNFTVNNSAAGTVNISSGVLDVYGVLSMVKGNLTIAASPVVVTLKSLATQTASVAAIPSGSAITGNVTVERYLTGGAGYRSYRLLSSPVFNAAVSSVNVYSLNYVQNSMYLTGNAGGGFDKTGNPTLYLFREDITPSNTTFTSGNYLGISAINNSPAYNYYLNGGSTAYNLPAGNGFLCFFRGSRAATSVAAETTTSYVPVTVTLSTTGTLNQGAIAVRNWYTPSSASIAYTTSNAGNAPVRGFNMVGNPYASAIDWSSFSSSSSSAGIYGVNVNPTVYLFDPLTKNFATYSAATGIATGNGGKIISSGQGFFVQANAASPSLTFNESAKSAAQLSAPSLLMGRPDVQAAYNSYLRLNLITDSVNRSDMVIGFNAAAKLSFNGIQDSEFLPGISSHQALAAIAADSVLAAVKFVPFPKSSLVQSVRLNVTARVSGQYTLLRSDFKEIPALYRVWLMDRFLKDSLDIRANTAYVFNIDLADTASFGPDRFLVVIRQDPALAVHLLNFTAAKATGGAQLVWNTENEQNYTDFTVERSSDGGKSFQVLGGFGSAAMGTYSFLDKNPPLTTDLYRLVIQNLDGSISYSKPIPLMYSSQSNNIIVSGISVYPNPAVAVVNLAINPGPEAPAGSSAPAYAITVVNSSGTVIKSAIATQNSWQFPVANLIPGTYFINVVNNLTKSLVGNGKFTKL